MASQPIDNIPRNHLLYETLAADDCDELLNWLRERPLAHFNKELNTLLVHAGIDPTWDCEATLCHAVEVETMLRSANYADFFAHMYDDSPDRWSEDLSGAARIRFIINCLTRARMMTADGAFDFSHKGTLESAPSHLMPWFSATTAAWRQTRIVFGHWSALGLLLEPQLIAIDTGCVWGRQLTAVQLDTGGAVKVIQVDGEAVPAGDS
jgi:bis(5'-nucleosyl)-tetraphosphatase (symmetrical)